MPEGDTVFRAALDLHRALSGRELVATDFRVPRLATVDLAGGRVVATVPRGKHLLTRIDHDRSWTLHTHLKMEGAWHIYPPGRRWRRPDHQARVVLSVAGATAVGFSLGVVELLARADEPRAVGHLGPDLLGAGWDAAEAERRLRASPDRPLVEALLDQTALAGIGNMYAAELCFLRGLHPQTPVGTVRDLAGLLSRARSVLAAGTRRAVQTTTGDLRPGERHWVYRRERRPCRRCGTTVSAGRHGPPGRDRTTWWCPSCQPPPPAT